MYIIINIIINLPLTFSVLNRPSKEGNSPFEPIDFPSFETVGRLALKPTVSTSKCNPPDR